MANDESPKDFQVNEATLDYLKLHIERQVSDRLVKWIGLPLGGGGLLAIFFGLFFLPPGQDVDDDKDRSPGGGCHPDHRDKLPTA